MGHYVNEEMIKIARNTDLYQYLITSHPSEIIREGDSVYLKNHDSVYIKKGCSRFYRYSNGDTGNSIDFLVNYLAYSFSDAVMELCDCPILPDHTEDQERPKLPCEQKMSFPKPGPYPYTRVFAYLSQTRGIDPGIINHLIQKGLVYQDFHSNAVFVNHDSSYYEIRGTYSEIKYHRSFRAPQCVPYWSIKAGKGKALKAYICESSIDAISLYELQRMEHQINETSLYCSIGGVAKQRAIDCISQMENAEVTLAVDNDPAGEQCRRANPELRSIIPSEKDWNDELNMRKKLISP